MDTTELIIYSSVGAIVFFIILYYTIKGAVSNGIKSSGITFRTSYIARMLSRSVEKQGVEKSQINEDFNNALSD